MAAEQPRSAAVVGGSGFIGRHLVAALVDGGADVTVLDRVRGPFDEGTSGRIRMVQGSLLERAAVRSAIVGSDVVFFLAGHKVKESSLSAPRAVRDGLVGLTYVAEECLAAGARRLVFASSSQVYGYPEQLPLSESHPVSPISIYGAVKASSEAILRAFSHEGGLSYVALRYFSVYGPGLEQQRRRHVEVLARWSRLLLRDSPVVIHGDGDDQLDFVHVDDVVRANLHAATSGFDGRAANIGFGRGTSLDSALHLLSKGIGRSPRIVRAARPALSTAASSVADITLARRELGFSPRISPEKGIVDYGRWMREAAAE